MQVFDVFDCVLNDLRLLDPAPALLVVQLWDQLAEVGQAVVHPIPTPFLDDPVGFGILERRKKREIM